MSYIIYVLDIVIQEMKQLPLSRKPQIIRLHELEQLQRNRYISQFSNCFQQYLPQKIWPILPLLADTYYTYTTICLCRRRLGQQYAYVAMYNRKNYEEEGVLVNSKTRLLMFVLQISQRYLLRFLLGKLWARLQAKVQKMRNLQVFRKFVGLGVEGVLEEGQMLMLMLFLLGWNKYFNLIDTILKNEYIYTYFNKDTKDVNYKIEGYMLLTVFIVRILKFIYKLSKSKQNSKKQKQRASQKVKGQQDEVANNKQSMEEEQLCRICYDNIKDKSITCCGHIFCWTCIVQYLGTNPECPVCRTSCQPREIVQLQNY